MSMRGLVTSLSCCCIQQLLEQFGGDSNTVRWWSQRYRWAGRPLGSSGWSGGCVYRRGGVVATVHYTYALMSGSTSVSGSQAVILLTIA